MSSEKQRQHRPSVDDGLDTAIQPPFQARPTRGVKPRHQERRKLNDKASTTNSTTTTGTANTIGTHHSGSKNTTNNLTSGKGRYGRTKGKDSYSRGSPLQNDNPTANHDRDLEVQPGAQAIPGIQPLPAHEASSGNDPRPAALIDCFDEETSAPHDDTNQNEAPTIFTAVLVKHDDDEAPDGNQSEAPLVRALPWTGYWNKQRVLMAIFSLLVVAGATTGIVISVAGRGVDATTAGSSNSELLPPTPSPTWSPTVAPTLHTRQWVLIGDLEPYWSEDAFGASVAMSKYGTKVVVGATGWEFESGRFNVFSYHENGIWKNLGSVSGSDTTHELVDSTAISEDGTIVAVGAPGQSVLDGDPGYNVSGIVRVYREEKNSTTGANNYVQLGSDLVGMDALDRFGWTVALSADGTVLATGENRTCAVKVFQYQPTLDDWVAIGNEDDFCQDVDAAVSAISLSNDGFTLAIGAPSAGFSGEVRVYHYSTISSSWLQLGQTLSVDDIGQTLFFDGIDAEFGTSVSLSDDGRILAIGAPGYGDLVPNTPVQSEVGIAFVFRFSNRSSNRWEALGQELNGISTFDRFGSGIALAANGDVVAIGATGSNDNGEDSGSVRIFRYNNSTSTWNLVGGGSISGHVVQGFAGDNIAVSQDGSRVVIGVTPAIASDITGYVEVFETGIFLTGGTFDLSVGGHGWRRWSLERTDVDSQERAFVAANVETAMADGDDIIQVHSGALYKFFFQSFSEWDWYEDYTSIENTTYFIWNGKNDTGELLAAGSTGSAPLTAVFLIADSNQRRRQVSHYGFQHLLHGPPQLDPYVPPQSLQGGASKTLGAPCSPSDVLEGKVAILQLITGADPQGTSWDLQAGGEVIAQNATVYTLPFTLHLQEICIPNSAEQLFLTIYYDSWCTSDGCCEDIFGHFLLVVDNEENYIYGTVGNCNNSIPIGRFSGTSFPSTSPTAFPTDSPTGPSELRYQIHVQIQFGSRPEEVEWVLKSLDRIHDDKSNRTTPVERIIAYGAQYSSKSVDKMVLETVDITWVVKDASPDLKLKFYFIEELNEDEEYSTVRLLSTVGNQEDTTEASDGLLLFSLDETPEGRKRKTIANISFFDSIA